MPLDGYRRVCARIAGVLLVLAAVPSAGGRLFPVASDAVRIGWVYALCSFTASVMLMLALAFLGVRVFSAEEEKWPAACITAAVALLLRVGTVVWQILQTETTWKTQIPTLVILGFSTVWLCLLTALSAGVCDFPGIFRLLLPLLPGAVFLAGFLFGLIPFLASLGKTDGFSLAAAGDALRLLSLLLCGAAAVLVGITCREDCD